MEDAVMLPVTDELLDVLVDILSWLSYEVIMDLIEAVDDRFQDSAFSEMVLRLGQQLVEK